MKKKLLTEETKLKLRENVENKIDEVTKEIDKLRKILDKIEKVNSFATENDLQLDLKGIRNLLEYRLFIGIIILDLSSSIRIYLNAKFQYEGLFSARQIIVIINEGYKKIYNFITEKDDGNKITKHRNNSFWTKEIGEIIKSDLPNLKNEYDLLTNKLDSYLNVNFKEIKTQRDLSIHYDKSPTKVYDMLAKLDIQTTFQKLIPFLDILNEMFVFTDKVNQAYQLKSENEKLAQDKRIEDLAYKLDNFKNDKNKSIILEFQEKILKLKDLFKA